MALGAALAAALLAAATGIELTKVTTGRREQAKDDVRRGALAVGLATVFVDWDLDVKLLDQG